MIPQNNKKSIVRGEADDEIKEILEQKIANGKYDDVLEYYNNGLDHLIQKHGEKHPLVNKLRRMIYKTQGQKSLASGDYVEALKYSEEELEVLIEIHGEKHPVVAVARSKIGKLYYESGNNKKALEEFRKSFKDFLEVFGKDHPQTAVAQSNIANVLFSGLGDTDGALLEYKKELNLVENRWGSNHPEVAAVQSSIGTVQFAKGEYGEALESFSKALDLYQKRFGENNVMVATTLSHIGTVHSAKGDYEPALKYFEKSLKLCSNCKDNTNPKKVVLRNKMGEVYYKMEDYKAALAEFRKAQEILLLLLKKPSSSSQKYCFDELAAGTHSNIGLVFFATGDFKTALSEYQEEIRIRWDLWGEKDPRVAIVNRKIGATIHSMAYSDSHDDKKAILAKFQSALVMLNDERYCKYNRLSAAIVHGEIGTVHYDQKEFEIALEEFSEAYRVVPSLDMDHPDISSILRIKIGATQYCLDDKKSAFRQYFHNQITTTPDMDQADIARLYNNQSAVLFSMGIEDISERYFERAISVAGGASLSDENTFIADLQNNRGNVLASGGNYEAAQVYISKALEIRERALGRMDPKTVQSRKDLEALRLRLKGGEIDHVFTAQILDDGELVVGAEMLKKMEMTDLKQCCGHSLAKEDGNETKEECSLHQVIEEELLEVRFKGEKEPFLILVGHNELTDKRNTGNFKGRE